MDRSLLIATVVGFAGVAAGAAGIYVYESPQLGAAQAELDTTKQALAALQQKSEPVFKQVKKLEKDNSLYEEQIVQLESKLSSEQRNAALAEQAAQSPAEAPAQAENTQDMLDWRDLLPPEELKKARDRIEEKKKEGPAGSPNAADVPRNADGTPLTPQQRRDQYVAQMQANMQDMYADAIAKTTDADAQDRLQTMSELTSRIFDLRQELKQAATPEQRDAIAQELRQTVQENQQLARDQQAYMLQQVAQQYGITDEDRQNKFVSSVQSTVKSPIFNVGQGNPAPRRGNAAAPRPK